MINGRMERIESNLKMRRKEREEQSNKGREEWRMEVKDKQMEDRGSKGNREKESKK